MRVLPLGGDVDFGFVAQDVRAILSKAHFWLYVEAKGVEPGRLVHDGVK